MKTMRSLFIKLTFFTILAVFLNKSLWAGNISYQCQQRPLNAVLTDLVQLHELPLLYQNVQIPDRTITLNCQSWSQDSFLNALLKNTNLTWQRVGNQIIIHERIQPPHPLVTINGYVHDAETAQSLPCANISVPGTLRGTMSDESGFFALNTLPTDSSDVYVQYIGYQPQTIPVENIQPEDTVRVSMQPHVLDGESIQVQANKFSQPLIINAPDKQEFELKQFDFIPTAARGDLNQTLQALPSVAAAPPTLDGLYIQGGTPEQNLVLFDGIPLYHTEHLGGFLSSLNPAAIKNVTIYKAGFPAQFGDRASSVIELDGQQAEQEKVGVGIYADLLHSYGYISAPISPQLKFYVSGQASYFRPNAVSLPFIGERKTYNKIRNFIMDTPQRLWMKQYTNQSFSDLTGRIDFEPDQTNHISFTLFKTEDRMEYNQEYWLSYNNVLRHELIQNTGMGLTWMYSFSDRLIMRNSFSLSQLKNIYDVVQGVYHLDGDVYGIAYRRFNLNDYRLYGAIEYQPTHWYQFTAGYEIGSIKLRNLISSTNEPLPINNTLFRNTDIVQSARQNILFLENKFLWKNIGSLTFGIRSSPYNVSNESFDKTFTRYDPITSYNLTAYLLPRVSIDLNLPYRATTFFRYGRYYQLFQRIPVENMYQGLGTVWLLSPRENGSSVAGHWSVGLQIPVSSMRIQASGYFKRLNKFTYVHPRLDTGNSTGFMDYLTTGSSEASGIECALQYSFKKFDLLLNYQYNRSIWKFPNMNNALPFYADHDRTHEIKSTISYRLGPVQLGLSSYFSTGTPYTPVIGDYAISLPSGSEKHYLQFGHLNSKRFPAFKRTDLMLKSSKSTKWFTMDYGFSILNLFDNNNSRFSFYKPGYYNFQGYYFNSKDIGMLGTTIMYFISTKF
ncbi:TonB-dependent receptor [candidate division KSB1 bacterium]|nr:TonB-dependent receptor [candidate division KSB1 bacterium]